MFSNLCNVLNQSQIFSKLQALFFIHMGTSETELDLFQRGTTLMYMNVITTRVHRRVVSMHTSSSKEAGLRLRGNMQKRIRQKTTLLTYFQRGTTLMLDMKYFNRAYKRRLCGCVLTQLELSQWHIAYICVHIFKNEQVEVHRHILPLDCRYGKTERNVSADINVNADIMLNAADMDMFKCSNVQMFQSSGLPWSIWFQGMGRSGKEKGGRR